MSAARSLKLLPVLVALIALLAACGGAAPLAGDDPASIARQVMSSLAARDITKLTDLACAAQKDEIADSFTGGLADIAPGTDPATLLQAIQIDTSKVVVGTATVSGDTATVPLTGSMKLTIDSEKLKPVVKAALAAQGMPSDDAAVDAALGFVSAFNGQEIPLDDQPITLKKENGAWKVCDA